MGAALCSSTTMTATGSTTVPVPAAQVEGVFLDLEGSPLFIPYLVEVERLTNDSGLEEGTRWREERIVCGRKLTLFKTVTNVVRCSKHEELRITVSVDLHRLSWHHQSAAETITITFVSVKEDACKVTWSMAFVSAGCLGKITTWLTRRSTEIALEKHINEEMDFRAAEAIRRSSLSVEKTN